MHLDDVRDETGVISVLEGLYYRCKNTISFVRKTSKEYAPASWSKFPFLLIDGHSTENIIQQLTCEITRGNSPFSTFGAHNTFSIILTRYVNADCTEKI